MKRRSFSHGGCLQLREFIQISNCCTLKLSNNTWWITFAPTVLNLYPSHFLELFHLGVPKKLEMVFITFIRTCAEKLIVFFLDNHKKPTSISTLGVFISQGDSLFVHFL